MFVVGRAIFGIGVGMNFVSVPVYQGEVAPAALRGSAVGCYMLGYSLGLFFSSLVEKIVLQEDIDDGNSWRYAVWPMVFCALILSVSVYFLPESPRHLIKHGKSEQAREALWSLRRGVPTAEVEREFSDMVNSLTQVSSRGDDVSHTKGLFKKDHRQTLRILAVAIGIRLVQTMTGLDAFTYFSSYLYISFQYDDKLLHMIQMTVFAFASICGMFILDRAGRRTLLLWGAVINFLILTLMGIIGGFAVEIPKSCVIDGKSVQRELCAHTPDFEHVLKFWAILITILIMLWCVMFAITLLPVPIVYSMEVLPIEYRASGMGAVCLGNCVGDFSSNLFNPLLFNAIGMWTYLIYAALSGFGIYFIHACVVETRGVPLEQIPRAFGAKEDERERRSLRVKAYELDMPAKRKARLALGSAGTTTTLTSTPKSNKSKHTRFSGSDYSSPISKARSAAVTFGITLNDDRFGIPTRQQTPERTPV